MPWSAWSPSWSSSSPSCGAAWTASAASARGPGWAPPTASGHQRIAALLAAAAAKLSRRRTGALIVIERDTGLGDMAETGVMMNADLSAELLASLFAPGYPLHDGAVIVRGDEIVAAGVMLPLAEREGSLEHYGTRHRAALGVTEQTDALAIVVSEESGGISLAQGGSHRARSRRGRAAPATLWPARARPTWAARALWALRGGRESDPSPSPAGPTRATSHERCQPLALSATGRSS